MEDGGDEYNVEIATSESGIYLGQNSIASDNNGIFIEAEDNVLVKENTVTASGENGVVFGSRMRGVEVSSNEITANSNNNYNINTDASGGDAHRDTGVGEDGTTVKD